MVLCSLRVPVRFVSIREGLPSLSSKVGIESLLAPKTRRTDVDPIDT